MNINVDIRAISAYETLRRAPPQGDQRETVRPKECSMSVPRESNSGPSSLPRTRMLKAAISGSFRRHMTAIYNAVNL